MELKIKTIREEKKLSQNDMAYKMNLSQSAYARFELSKTKIDLNRLESFAAALNMSLIDVITYPDKYINLQNLAKEMGKNETEVIVQIKVKESKRKEVLDIVLGENNLELLNK